MLTISRKSGQSIEIDNNTIITVDHIGSSNIKLTIRSTELVTKVTRKNSKKNRQFQIQLETNNKTQGSSSPGNSRKTEVMFHYNKPLPSGEDKQSSLVVNLEDTKLHRKTLFTSSTVIETIRNNRQSFAGRSHAKVCIYDISIRK